MNNRQLRGVAAANKAMNSDTTLLVVGLIRPSGRVIERRFAVLADALEWVSVTRQAGDVLFCCDKRRNAPDAVNPQKFSQYFGGGEAEA